MSTPTLLSPETMDTATLVREAVNAAFIDLIACKATGPALNDYDLSRWLARRAATIALGLQQAEFQKLTESVLRQRAR